MVADGFGVEGDGEVCPFDGEGGGEGDGRYHGAAGGGGELEGVVGGEFDAFPALAGEEAREDAFAGGGRGGTDEFVEKVMAGSAGVGGGAFAPGGFKVLDGRPHGEPGGP